MNRLIKIAVSVLIVFLTTTVLHAASLNWQQVGILPGNIPEKGAFSATATSSMQSSSMPSSAIGKGAFVGVHNDALIIAGGEINATGVGSLDSERVNLSLADSIWVATKKQDTTIGDKPARLDWHRAAATLSHGLAYGAAVSHTLGVIVIGGTDGISAQRQVHLLRWDMYEQKLSRLQLPATPGPVVNSGAALIGDRLYVMENSASGSTGRLFMLDLSTIQTNASGGVEAVAGIVQLKEKSDVSGKPVSAWQSRGRFPGAGENNRVMLVAQHDGRADQLYIITSQQIARYPGASSLYQQPSYQQYNEVWAYNPMATAQQNPWVRKADIKIDGKNVPAGAVAPMSFGPSHILLLPAVTTVAGDQASSTNTGFAHNQMNSLAQQTPALFYNTITDAWTNYHQTPLTTGAASPLTAAATAASVAAVKWHGKMIVISNLTDAKKSWTTLWRVTVTGMEKHFGWQNMVVLSLYLLAVVMVGVYFVFKNNSTDDYFRGGQHIPWWAAACSIYATMLSSLTYVALPALVYRTDWLVYLGVMMILVVAPIAIYVAMPFFRQIDATSAYEYLSRRFNMPVRLFASGLFSLFHIGRMGIVMALTALALAAVTPLDAWQCVLIMGVLCLIYCTLGGVEAVIWTDTIQTIVLLVGAVVCFVFILSGIDGGFWGFIERGMAGEKFKMVNMDFGPGSITTLSIWVIVIGGIGQNLSSYTADQAVVQRYMVTSDASAAAKSIWTNAVLAVPGALLFFCIGTGLYCFYQVNPQKLDPTIQIDQIFPTFIATELPVGIAGLIVAGIFAAAQSTVSTSMNSIATTLVTDFLRPFNVCRSESAYLNAARLLTFLMGVLGTAAALIFISPEIRSLMEQYFVVIGMFMGALGGLFVLGVTTRTANGLGSMIGLVAGVGLMFTVWRMQWADGYLFATIGIITCLFVGYVASLLLPADKRDLSGLTLYTMRAQP